MFSIWKVIIGILLSALGVIMINHNIRKIRRKGKDHYGGDYQIKGGAVTLIIMGLITIIKEIGKL